MQTALSPLPLDPKKKLPITESRLGYLAELRRHLRATPLCEVEKSAVSTKAQLVGSTFGGMVERKYEDERGNPSDPCCVHVGFFMCAFYMAIVLSVA